MRDIDISRSFWVVGKDGYKHLKLAEEKESICGMSVSKKRLNPDSAEYTCYECSCTADGRYWGMSRVESLTIEARS